MLEDTNSLDGAQLYFPTKGLETKQHVLFGIPTMSLSFLKRTGETYCCNIVQNIPKMRRRTTKDALRDFRIVPNVSRIARHYWNS